MKRLLPSLAVSLAVAIVGPGPLRSADGALTHAPLGSMTATASGTPTTIGPPPTPNDPAAQILTLNGISVSQFQLGTTTFSGAPNLQDQLPQYADEFGLSANASADGQTYVQTMFPQDTAVIYLIEKGGNDPGTIVGLDANGQEIGTTISFTANDFNKTLGYTVFQGQQAGGMVISSDILLRGIRFKAPGLDPVTIASLPYATVNSGEEFTWGPRIADGSWSNTSGWRKNGVNTAEIPEVLQAPPANGTADPVRILSGTVRVNAGHQSALSLQVDAGATVNVSSGFQLKLIEAANLAAGASLQLGGTLVAGSITGSGSVGLSNGGVLEAISGSAASATASGVSIIRNSGSMTLGSLSLSAGATLRKQGGGTLTLSQANGANALPGGSTLQLEDGALAVINGGADGFGAGSIQLAGGDLVLSVSQAGAAAFDAPLTASSPTIIRAAQLGGGIAGGTAVVGGVSGVTLPAGGAATLQTADGYTLRVAGVVTGGGRVIFDDGARIDLTAAVTPAVVEYRGNTANLTGTANAAPSQARLFVPTESTPDLTVAFAVGGSAQVVIDGQVDGSVAFAGATTFTGPTVIRRGALRPSAGLFASSRIQFDGGRTGTGVPLGNFNGDESVDGGDYAHWRASFASTGADADGDGDSDGVDFLTWQRNFGAAVEPPGPAVLAVLESSDAALTRNIGSATGEIQWLGGGGFASRGNTSTGQLVVNLEGGATLAWDSAAQGFSGQALQLGSPSADGRVILQNNLAMGVSAERVIQIADNPATNADWAEISGVISSGGSSNDRLTIGATGGGSFQGGLLKLTGQNTFASKLRIEDATVMAQQGVGLPTASNLEFSANNDNRPAIFATSGTFARNIGQNPGEVFWADQDTPNPQAGGFAAIGGPLTVSLEGGVELAWNSPTAGFNGQDLQLGSPYGDNVVTFANPLDIQGADRNIETFDNPFTTADRVRLTGAIRTTDATPRHLTIDGSATVLLEGLVDLRGTGDAVTGDLVARDTTTVFLVGDGHHIDDVDIEGSANVFINGAVTVEDDIFFGDSANQPQSTAGFGGAGTITTLNEDTTRLAVEAFTRLEPGADRNQTGLLTVNFNGDGAFEVETGGIYEMDFRRNGASLEHDSVDLNSVGGSIPRLSIEPAGAEKWTLRLNALNDVTGLVAPEGQYDLFTWDTQMDFLLSGVNISLDVGPGSAALTNVTLSSSQFNVGSATVRYELNGDYSGRVYVSGLSPLAAGEAVVGVPEPSSALLALGVAAVGVGAARKRRG